MRLRFDRGTIVIEDPPAGVDVSELPGVLWDARIGAHRAPGRFHALLVAELERRGVRFSDSVRPAGHLSDGHESDPAHPDTQHPDTQQPDTQQPDAQQPDAQQPRGLQAGGQQASGHLARNLFAPIALRPYQEAALFAWQTAGRRGLVVLPTGSGKTRVALAAMARTRLRSLCLVPTRMLLEQWLRELGAVYSGDIGCYGDGERRLAPITVATFESAYRTMDRIGNRFDLLVIDEAHHFGCGLRDEALEMAVAACRLGLTATPPREPAVLARLAVLLGPTLYELGIADLAGRYLAGFDVVPVHVDLSPSERTAYETLHATFRGAQAQFWRLTPEASWEDFVRTACRTHDGRRALTAWRKARRMLALPAAKGQALASLLARHRDSRVLVFTADNETAYTVARRHLIMPLTCDIGRSEREDVLGRFRRGELRALVSARVLNEGFDVPDADVAIVVAGALGEREHVQRVGRLLRPAAGKRARVYELVTRRTMEVRQANRRRRGLAAHGTACL